MAVTLEIRDGDPYWWNSADIWVVPGNDPNGMPGQPIAGEPAFLWGRVRNTGNQPASGARVNFYWSNPATGVLRSNSTLVGSGFVDLNPGESKEVLCVIPWIPVIVNDGHECVVAEVIHSSDPLPLPVPDAFNPPAYHQIAQRNLSVLAMRKMMLLPIQVAAPLRIKRSLHVVMEIGGALDPENLKQIGLGNYRPARRISVKAGLTLEAGCAPLEQEELAQEVRVALEAGTARAVYLQVWPPELERDTYALLHVICRDEKQVVGGISYILIRPAED